MHWLSKEFKVLSRVVCYYNLKGGGFPHQRLNSKGKPIDYKYLKGKMKSTLQNGPKEPEIVGGIAFVICLRSFVVCACIPRPFPFCLLLAKGWHLDWVNITDLKPLARVFTVSDATLQCFSQKHCTQLWWNLHWCCNSIRYQTVVTSLKLGFGCNVIGCLMDSPSCGACNSWYLSSLLI